MAIKVLRYLHSFILYESMLFNSGISDSPPVGNIEPCMLPCFSIFLFCSFF